MATVTVSQTIELFSAIVARPAIIPLVADFETASGHHVHTKFDLNPFVKTRIEGGESFDVLVVNPWMIDDLIRQGKALASPHVAFGRVEMGVFVRAGDPIPACGTVEDLSRTLLNAKSIAYAGEGTSGKTFQGVLQRLGLLDTVSTCLRPIPGDNTARTVATGEAGLGVLPISTILEAPGVALAGTFPPELGVSIDLSVAISSSTAHATPARALLDFLIRPEAIPLLSATGFHRQ